MHIFFCSGDSIWERMVKDMKKEKSGAYVKSIDTVEFPANTYDDGNIPDIDLPGKNGTSGVELPGKGSFSGGGRSEGNLSTNTKASGQEMIPDDVPRRDGPGGEASLAAPSMR